MSRRIVAAFAIVPVVVVIVARLGFPIVWSMRRDGGQFSDPAGTATSIAVLTGIVGLLVTLLGAVPAFLWMKKRGPLSLSRVVVAGIVLGNVPLVAIAMGALYFTLLHIVGGTISEHLSPPLEVIAGFLRVSVIGSVLGAISAFVFWLVGIRGTDVISPRTGAPAS